MVSPLAQNLKNTYKSDIFFI